MKEKSYEKTYIDAFTKYKIPRKWYTILPQSGDVVAVIYLCAHYE